MARGGAELLPELEVDLLPPPLAPGMIPDCDGSGAHDHEFRVGAWIDSVRAELDAGTERMTECLAAVRAWCDRLAHDYLASPPVRTRSLVQRHVWVPLPDIVAALDAGAALRADGRGRAGLELDGPARWRREVQAYELACCLRLPCSYPRLGMWLTVEPWRHNRSVISLRLRSTRRWRYPRRYFAAAHRAIDTLVADIGQKKDTTGVCPRSV